MSLTARWAGQLSELAVGGDWATAFAHTPPGSSTSSTECSAHPAGGNSTRECPSLSPSSWRWSNWGPHNQPGATRPFCNRYGQRDRADGAATTRRWTTGTRTRPPTVSASTRFSQGLRYLRDDWRRRRIGGWWPLAALSHRHWLWRAVRITMLSRHLGVTAPMDTTCILCEPLGIQLD